MRWRRRPVLPAKVREVLGLDPTDPRERVLAWTELTAGGHAVATVAGLRIDSAFTGVIRRPWVEVDRASWQRQSGTIAVWWTGGHVSTALEVGDDTRFADVVQDRVTASVLLSEEVQLGRGRSVRVALRRDDLGRLVTQAAPGPGVRLEDPDTAAAVERSTRTLMEQVGAADQG